jgi:hypothetical protein
VGTEHKITVTDKAGYQKIVDRARGALERTIPKNVATQDRATLAAALEAIGK